MALKKYCFKLCAINSLNQARHMLKESPLRAVTLFPMAELSEEPPPYPAEEAWLY